MRMLVLGEVAAQLVCRRPAASLAEVDAFAPEPGGAGAQIALAAARAGGDVELAGAVGDDAWGRWLRFELGRAGVGCTWLARAAGLATPARFTFGPAGGPPIEVAGGDPVPAGAAGLADRVPDAVAACDALVLTTDTLAGEADEALTLAARDRARELGRPVVVAPAIRAGRWEAPAFAGSATRGLVKGAFLVVCSREEARLLSGEEEPSAAAAGLLAMGAAHVVVTLGASGALVRGGGLKVDVPARPTDAVSPFGAGEALCGVLLARLAATDFYGPAIGAALADAVEAGTQAAERWGARP